MQYLLMVTWVSFRSYTCLGVLIQHALQELFSSKLKSYEHKVAGSLF